MATPPNVVISSAMTGKFRFEVGFMKTPVLFVEMRQNIKRYSPHCDVVERIVWQKATSIQAFAIQFRYSGPEIN
ncbi:hypothetical protein [Kluyvera ascorbata]|uniref:hypothetical protein n=1 Tax=Kluyvera ascorbata TaxID=51288 RepID=UPI00205E1BB1|nr:hypothetical protein [Kluyvera ascorbata]UPQ69705.1 hypothetical protein MY052_13040 [Kluyvera ascorbata]